jgi:hypothetical protein
LYDLVFFDSQAIYEKYAGARSVLGGSQNGFSDRLGGLRLAIMSFSVKRMPEDCLTVHA